MALNGSVSVEATPKGQDLLVFSWSAVQDAAANTSTVSWMMQLVASTAGEINGVPVERDWTVTVDGQEFTGTANVNISNNETKTLATGEIVLQHNEDGTRSFAFAFSQDLSITWGASSGNPQFIGTVSGSGTGELDTIAKPEPEKFDIQGFMMGLAMALCGRPVQWPKGEPVAYLYGPDKVRLPKLPEWDKERYPYAYICFKESTGYVFAVNSIEVNVNSEKTMIVYSNDYIRNLVDGEWAAGRAGLGFTPVWANYDVCYAEAPSTVVLPASDPVPVYE